MTLLRAPLAYGGGVDEARRVIERLGRIDALRRAGGSRGVLLDEVRMLLEEGEAWLAAEPAGVEAAREALDRCRNAFEAAPPGDAVAPRREATFEAAA